MTPEPIDAWLASSFEDRRLSRGERQALAARVAALGPGVDREAIRARAFEIARSALARPEDGLVLDWLEDVVKAIREKTLEGPSLAEAHFSPGDDCLRAIERFLGRARRAVDVCVFTITDDRLASALLDAHGRGIAVRILTDDAKAEDLGSDVDRLAQAGIPVRIDRSPFHMHHKFAVADGKSVLTGSYNWTRGAARDNEENLIVTDEPRLIAAFVTAFERLWARLG